MSELDQMQIIAGVHLKIDCRKNLHIKRPMVCSSEQLTGLSLCFCIDVIVCLRFSCPDSAHSRRLFHLYTTYVTSALHEPLLVIAERRDRFLRHRDQREHVEDRHEANAYIAEIPDEGVGRHAADEEIDQRDDLIYIL